MATQAIEVPKKGPESETALVPTTPFELMAQAIKQGISAEQLQILQEMHFKQLDRDAKAAFIEAKRKFQQNAPTIRKTRSVTYDKGANPKPAFFYAPLEEICPLIIEQLNKAGITHRWRSDPPFNPGWIRVVCVLTHELGYSEEFGQEAPSDPSGGKNGIQAVISSTSYLERVTLLGVCGLSARGMDTDGNVPAQVAGIPDERFVELQDGIINCNSIDELKAVYRAACQEADASSDQEAKRQFSELKNKRYKELYNAGR